MRDDRQPGKIIVYPNPSFDGKVKVAFDDINERDVALTDMNGRMVKQWTGITNNNLEMDKITPGYYSLHVIQDATKEGGSLLGRLFVSTHVVLRFKASNQIICLFASGAHYNFFVITKIFLDFTCTSKNLFVIWQP